MFLHTIISHHLLFLFSNIRKPQILLNLPHLAKLLPRIFGTHTRRHNNIIPLLPINRRRNTLFIAHLQTINHPQHLRRVSTRTSRIRHCQPDLLVLIDDEDGANGKCDAAGLLQRVEIVLRDHVVEVCDVTVCVGDDGEVDGGLRGFVYVGDPVGVGGQVVGALGVALVRVG